MTCCNTTEVLSTSGDTNTLQTQYFGDHKFDLIQKILPATLTPARKWRTFSYLNIIWSVTLHSCFFWQANTTILQGSEDCGGHLLRRKQKVNCSEGYCWAMCSSCLADTCAQMTGAARAHANFGCCQSWTPGDKKTIPSKLFKRKKPKIVFSEKRHNNSHCHSPSALKTGQKDAEPAVFLQLLLWVLIQDGPKKRAQSFVWA